MTEMKLSPSWKRILRWALAGGCFLILGLFVVVSLQIGSDVDAAASEAMHAYPGDRIESLLAAVDCSDCSLPRRNRAVWALGQLGDARALEGLRKYYTGQACDHGRELCQRELGKAISHLEGSVNVTALVWRKGV
jgi:hypothetical protein